MIFFGQYRYSLDDKKRVIVPAKLREIAGAEGSSFQITTLTGEYMVMYTNTVWEQLTSELTAKALPDQKTLDLQTLLFGRSEKVDCDKQERITLRNAADYGIQREVVFVGVSNHIQIWAPDRYEQKMTQLEKNSSTLIQGLYT